MARPVTLLDATTQWKKKAKLTGVILYQKSSDWGNILKMCKLLVVLVTLYSLLPVPRFARSRFLRGAKTIPNTGSIR